MAEIASFFGPSLVWSPTVPKRTVLQDAVRGGRPLADCRGCAARELTHAFGAFAERIGTSNGEARASTCARGAQAFASSSS
jgi:hypothetical protein